MTNASRMDASICAAAGLEALICFTTTAYVEKAVHLATHLDELAAIRQRLVAERKALPLFDLVRVHAIARGGVWAHVDPARVMSGRLFSNAR